MAIKRIWIILIIILYSCSGDKKSVIIPEDIINKEDFSSIITNVIILEGYNSRIIRLDTADIKISHFYNDLFNDYNITKTEFDKSYTFYSEHPKLMKEIFELSEKKFKLKEDRVTKESKNITDKKKKSKKSNLLPK